MPHVSTNFVRLVRGELDTVVQQALAISEAARFRRIRDSRGVVTALQLTEEQRAAAAENGERLSRCSKAIVSFLRRHGLAGIADVEAAAAEMSRCAMLRWTDREEVTERAWRTKLHRELTKGVAELERPLMTDGRQRLAVRNVFQPFRVRIRSAGSAQWLIDAGGTTARASMSKLDVPLAAPDTFEPFGRMLFNTIFAGAVGNDFHRARESAPLRVEIDTCDAQELHALPWELLHDGQQFLALSTRCCVARCVPAACSSPANVEQPLRILVMFSAVPELQALDGEKERETLQAALAPLTMLGTLEVDTVPDSSVQSLRRRLRTAASAGRPHHVWHFIGHGGSGTLVMIDDAGKRRDVDADDLRFLFEEQSSLHLAVLNACESVKFERDGATAGIGAGFLSYGVPAVIATQRKISDDAGILFTEELYGALSEKEPIETALTEARRSLFLGQMWHDWFCHVLLIPR